MGIWGEIKKVGKRLVGAIAVTAIGIATGGVAFALGAIAKSVLVNTALSYVASALSPKSTAAAQELQDNKVTNRNPIASRRIVYGETRVGGTVVFMESTGNKNEYLHLVIALATHELTAIDEVYFGDELVWDGTYQDGWDSHAEITPHLGSPTQAADPNLVSRVTDWTVDHKLSGVAYLYVRLKYDRDKFASGIPNISAVVRGRKVWTGSTTEYSNNPVWCMRDYLLDQTYGMAVNPAEINETAFSTAATVCDDLTVTSTGTQKRYTMDGVVNLAKSRAQVIEEMLTSMGGVFSYSGGQFHIHASKYYAPTMSFDESDFTGDITIQTRQSRRDLYNGVKGVFNSKDDNYITTDYPPVVSTAYALEDGDPSYVDINLPFTTDSTRAQRLAKLVLLQGRQQISATIPLNTKSLKVKAGDFIQISNARLGWVNKVFRVTNYQLSIDSSGVIGTSLDIVETSSAIYDWTTDDITPFVAGKTTNLPVYYSVNQPTSLVTTAGSLVQTDGTVQPYIDLSWTDNDAFTAYFQLEYRFASNPYNSITTTNASYRLENVVAGASYDFKVRAVNRLGARSSELTGSIAGVGDTGAPSAPTGLTAEGQANGAYLSWTNPTDADLDVIEIYESADTIQANAVLVGTTKGNSFFRGALQNGVTRYYWVKALDFTGNRSDFNAASGVEATTVIPVDDTLFVGNVKIVDSLTTGYGVADTGRLEFLTTDETLYRWDGSAWTSGVQVDEAAGSIIAQQLSVVTLDAITANMGTINAGKLQNDDETFIVDLDNKKIYIA